MSHLRREITIDLPNGDQEYLVCDVVVVNDDGELSAMLSNPISGEVLNPAFDENRVQDRETNWPWVAATDEQLADLLLRAQSIPAVEIAEQLALCPS